jgi:hypothetical protein
MDILKQYDEYLTSNLNELSNDLSATTHYSCVDANWHEYMRDLYKYSIESFIEDYNIDIHTIMPYRDDFKRTFNRHPRVIDAWNSVRELMIDSKLRDLDSDFQ